MSTERVVPATDFSHPALMVKCPTCSAEPGHRCYLFGKEVDQFHVARGDAYETWKLSLRNDGFVEREKDGI